MAVTNTAAFGQLPFWGMALVTAAKAAIGTSTNTNTVAFSTYGGTLATGANGLIITGASAIPMNTVTAQWCAIYYSVDAGTTLRPFLIGTMAAYTAAATLAPTPLSFSHFDGSPVSPANPVLIPGTGSGTTPVFYAGMGVAIADGAVFTLNGSIL